MFRYSYAQNTPFNVAAGISSDLRHPVLGTPQGAARGTQSRSSWNAGKRSCSSRGKRAWRRGAGWVFFYDTVTSILTRRATFSWRYPGHRGSAFHSDPGDWRTVPLSNLPCFAFTTLPLFVWLTYHIDPRLVNRTPAKKRIRTSPSGRLRPLLCRRAPAPSPRVPFCAKDPAVADPFAVPDSPTRFDPKFFAESLPQKWYSRRRKSTGIGPKDCLFSPAVLQWKKHSEKGENP